VKQREKQSERGRREAREKASYRKKESKRGENKRFMEQE